MNANLKVRSEITVNLAQNITFGRNSEVDYVLEDNKMSGKHCRIILKEDRLELVDLGSKNGTYLNGIRIDHSEIFIGDEIKLGDTFVTLLASKMEQRMIEMLTFPGPFKDRLQYELKADFTGARDKNQAWNKNHPGEKSSVYSAQEVDLRKRARTRIKLSKDEIKSKSPLLSSFSFVIDLSILLSMILLPVYLVNRIIHSGGFLGISADNIASAKVVVLTIMEIAVIAAYLMSQRYMRYTVGEKISGIEDLHQKQ